MTWASSLNEAKEGMRDAIAGYMEAAMENDIDIECNEYVTTQEPKGIRQARLCSARDRLLAVGHRRRAAVIGEWQHQHTAIAA